MFLDSHDLNVHSLPNDPTNDPQCDISCEPSPQPDPPDDDGTGFDLGAHRAALRAHLDNASA